MTSSVDSDTSPSQPHPRGLYTLFFTEMWERFSYYGMRALLVLFMVDRVRNGLGLDDKLATAIYGLYTASAYVAALPGGWCADRILGPRKAVWYGGLLIAAGHFTLAIPSRNAFFPALLLIVLGTGLLKPNVSVLVGELYPEAGARRDAGFTIFYMGINLGAFIGPLVCSTLGERINWHLGFAAAGVGMVAGLVQFRLFSHHLGEAGTKAPNPIKFGKWLWMIVIAIAVVAGVFIFSIISGQIRLNPLAIALVSSQLLAGGALLYFILVFAFGRLDAKEKRNVGLIFLLFVLSAVFWAGFEQAGSSFNLFAERYTHRYLQALQFTIPAGWFQSLGALFVILLAPAMAAFWMLLARRGIEHPAPLKFAIALILLGGGFVVMASASLGISNSHKAWPTWLIATYLLHSLGELCLSPVGLSSVTRLSPRRFTGQMMGIWFVATALGNLLAGLLAGQVVSQNPGGMSLQFLQFSIVPIALGGVLVSLSRPLSKWSGAR